MDIDQDIRDRIERSFGDGPTQPAVDPRLLERGRRALTRRRRVVAGAAGAAVLVVGATTIVAVGRSTAGPGPVPPQIAGSPSGDPTSAVVTPTPEPPTRAEVSRALRRPLAEYDDRGRLVVDPDAEVLTRINDPFTHGATDDSVALELSFRGATYWIAQYHSSDGSSGGAGEYPGDQEEQTFRSWVKGQDPGDDTGSSVGPDVWPGTVDADLVHFSQDGSERLVANPGARIVDQRPHVSVGSSFAGPGDTTAAGEVVSADGTHLYVLARAFDGKPGQFIYVSQTDGGRDLAAFLDLARHRYAEGGGGLL